MIVFGTAIDDPDDYNRYAGPGIARAVEPGAEVLAFQRVEAIGRSYNLLLDQAAERDNLTALVLVDEALEITDPGFADKVRRALAPGEVGIVGCAGATGSRGLAWWEGSVSSGQGVHRYRDFGGGDFPAFSWTERRPAPDEVEVLDGSLLVLSPWAVQNVRFDEALSLDFGHNVDYCLQVLAAGRRAMTADFEVVYHRSIGLVDNLDLWKEAHIHVAEKWDDQLAADEPNSEGWKQRARRAEADREAAQTIAYSASSILKAELAPLERELARATGTRSWQITQPLRQLNMWRRTRGRTGP